MTRRGTVAVLVITAAVAGDGIGREQDAMARVLHVTVITVGSAVLALVVVAVTWVTARRRHRRRSRRVITPPPPRRVLPAEAPFGPPVRKPGRPLAVNPAPVPLPDSVPEEIA